MPRGEQRYWRSVQEDPAIKQVFTGRGACGDGGPTTAPSTAPWWKNLGDKQAREYGLLEKEVLHGMERLRLAREGAGVEVRRMAAREGAHPAQ